MIIMKILQQLCLLGVIALPVSTLASPILEEIKVWGAEQRELNDTAASLDMVRHRIIDSRLNHRPGENLVTYLSSLSKALPNESQAAYDKRFNGYLSLLNFAEHKLMTVQIPLTLSDKSARNMASWGHIKNVKHDFPVQMKRLIIAWKLSVSDHKAVDSKMFVTAVQSCLAGYEALRDVRP